MGNAEISDIIAWDVHNWSQALPFWESLVDLDSKQLKCLELGGNHGGLSLWLAMKGHQVICSDLHNPESEALKLHQKYEHHGKITYQAIDASVIPYTEEFDVVIFKSIIGGICRNGNNALKQKLFEEMYRSLKPGGYLLFAENLSASFVHKQMREKFTNWGAEWNYLSVNEVKKLLAPYASYSLKTTGFFGTFGRSEAQRNFLGHVDSFLRPIIPVNQRYIVLGVAKK